MLRASTTLQAGRTVPERSFVQPLPVASGEVFDLIELSVDEQLHERVRLSGDFPHLLALCDGVREPVGCWVERTPHVPVRARELSNLVDATGEH